MSEGIKKLVLAVWYLALLTVAVDALLEWGYPRSNYSPGPWGPITQALSLGLILGTGIPMFFYLWKRNPGRAGGTILVAVFLVSTVLLVGLLAPNAVASAERRVKAQWYANDLRSQGINVVDSGPDYYRHGGGAHRLDSYAEVASTAKSINCTTVYLHCGTPMNFLFFLGDGLQMVFYGPTGEYLYYAPYNASTGISLPTDPTPTPYVP